MTKLFGPACIIERIVRISALPARGGIILGSHAVSRRLLVGGRCYCGDGRALIVNGQSDNMFQVSGVAMRVCPPVCVSVVCH